MSDTRRTLGTIQAIDRLQLAIALALPKHENEKLSYLNNLSFELDQISPEDPILALPVDELLNKITTRMINTCPDTKRMLLTQDLWLHLWEELVNLANQIEESSATDLSTAGHDQVIATHRATRAANHKPPATMSPSYWHPMLWSPAHSVNELKQEPTIHSRFGSPSIATTESETEAGKRETPSPLNNGYLASDDEDDVPSPRRPGVNPFSF